MKEKSDATELRGIITDPWKLIGHDTFDSGTYTIISADTEEEVLKKAKSEMADIKKLQPDESSGGQGFGGIQDRLYIVRPDGTRYRYLG